LAGHPSTLYTLGDLPKFDIRWDDPVLEDRPDAHGCAVITSDGCYIALRTSEHPEDLERTTIHELQHLADVELIDEMSLAMIEARAEVTAALFGPRESVARRLQALSLSEPSHEDVSNGDADRLRRLRLVRARAA
jgi:hypothetical protein